MSSVINLSVPSVLLVDLTQFQFVDITRGIHAHKWPAGIQSNKIDINLHFHTDIDAIVTNIGL